MRQWQEKEETDTCQTFLVSSCHPHECLGVAVRGAEEPLAVWIFADAFEDGSYSSSHLLFASGAFLRGGVETRHGGFGWWVGGG